MKGLFITIEGPDGSGKSTQIKLLKDYLQNKGYDIVLTREPGGTKISEKIRNIILNKENKSMHSRTEALLYAASRAQHVEELIKPALKENKIVICDRFVDSSLIYQGIGRNLGMENIYNLNLFAMQDIIPNLTLLFDIDMDKAKKRKENRGNLDRLESEKDAFHEDVFNGYKKLKDLYPQRIKSVKANGSIKQVHEEIINIINSFWRIKMYFDNIIGHDRPKQFILNSIRKNRISHAYLFEGSSGIGKMMFSMELSKILLETNNLENDPDLKILKPDGASFKIGQIRDLQLDIIIKPYKNRKIYILEDAHKMTVQAQNALLKTLEEPPEYALIILIVENSSSMLDTIKSRCEVVKFSPLTQVQIQNYLVDKKNINSQRAKIVASFSVGILSKALELCYSDEFNNKRNEIQEYLNIIQSRDLIDMYTINTKLEKHKSNLNEVMDMLITYFRDILMIKQGVDESLIINLDQIEFLSSLSKKFTYFQISNIIDIIDESNKNLMKNCNFNMVIGTMILNIYEVIK